MKSRTKSLFVLSCLTLFTAAPLAHADIAVGVVLSATGGASSQGRPEKNVIDILPPTLAGEPVKYIILDDATDPSLAIKNAKKLISEDHVDALIAASNTPSAIAIAGVAAENKTPHISMAPFTPAPAQFPWVFVVPQPAGLMIEAILENMQATGVKTVGYIGYSDSWGDLCYKALTSLAGKYGLKVVNNERYARNDSSVVAQALKTKSLHPDAVLIGAAGTPAALPQITLVDNGYKGKVYQTHGAVNGDFLRIGGKGVEGALAPIGPVVVYKDLADSDPIKKVSADFMEKYSKAYGDGPVNAFTTWAYDAYLLLNNAAGVALKTAKPGTEQFRAAIRDALENHTTGLVGTNGIYNISATNHNGLDERARVMVQVKNGQWRLAK